jgi:opacity protein-like surface antigen
MRKAILGAASALALASPAMAADLPVPRYSEVPSYERGVQTYEYRSAPPVVVEEPAPVVSETVVVRRPVIVAPPPVVVEEYPIYAAPRVYGAPNVYAYAGPVWRDGGGHRRHFRGRW